MSEFAHPDYYTIEFVKASKRGKCSVCSQDAHRSKRFLRIKREHNNDIFAQRDEWLREPIIHAKCESTLFQKPPEHLVTY